MINALRDPIDGITFSIKYAAPLEREQIMAAAIRYLLTRLDPTEREQMLPEFEIPPQFGRQAL